MEEDKANKKILLKLILLVISIWGISAVLIMLFLSEWSERGTFGDLFGAVNALFSALAFAVLIYTIVVQRQEIKENRKEIEKSSKLQRKAQEVLIKQVEQTHLSAQMSAMNILVDYYNNQINNAKNSDEIIEKAKQKRKQIISQIDDLVDGLNDVGVE